MGTAAMAEDNEPSLRGLTLFEAFAAYTNPETLRAGGAAHDELRKLRDVVARHDALSLAARELNRFARFKARLDSTGAWHEATHDFWQKFVSGELVAWGAEESPTTDRGPIPKSLWWFLEVADWGASALSGPGGLRFYKVLVYEAPPAPPARAEADVDKGGRPSREDEIIVAILQLLDRGEIDRNTPKPREKIRLVREEVMRRAGNRDRKGLGDEVIRKLLAKRFPAGKRKRIKSLKTIK